MNQELWQQAQILFEQALVLKEQDRSSFVDTEASGNNELKKLLKAMLAAESDADFMQAQPAISVNESLHSDQVGQFGHFKVIEKIAIGGMGRIFKAHSLNSDIKIFVALKLIRRELLSDHVALRFENEKSILGKLKHHHIAALIDAGVVNETPYIATEWVNGKPIDEFVTSQSLSIEQIINLFLQVCDAVAYAHQQLVIHRDIKPANIFIDENGHVKLLDFGIAKLIDVSTDHLTQTQIFTPDYAAPEQINGEVSSTKTDIYALGVLLFELLVGEKRFRHDSSSISERISAVTQPKTELASQRMSANNHRQVQKVKGALDTIINQAMHPDPNRRYDSVYGLISDIKRYLNHLPIQAMGDGFIYRSRMFFKRNFWPSAMGFVLVLSLLGGLIYSNHQKQQAIEAKILVQNESQKNQQMLKFFKDMMHFASPVNGGSTQISVQEMFEKSSQKFNLDDISDDKLKADVAGQVAEVYGEFSAHELKVKYNQVALAYYAVHLPQYASEFLSRHLSTALAYRNQNKNELALDQLVKAYEQVKNYQLNAETEAQVLVNLAEFQKSLDQNEIALKHLSDAEQIATRNNDTLNLGKVKYYQYLILQYRLPPDESEVYLAQAMNYFEQAHEGIHPNILGTKNSMAIKLKVEGRYQEAVTLFQEMHAGHKQLYGYENHNQLINHADALYYLGHFSEAADMINQSISIMEKNDVGEGFSLMAARVIQSRALLELGMYDASESLLKLAIEYFSEKLPSDHVVNYTLQTYWLDLLLKSNQIDALDFDVSGLINSVAELKNESNDLKRRYVNTQMISATYYWVKGELQKGLNHFELAHQTIKDISYRQEWPFWYIESSVLSLKRSLNQPFDQNQYDLAISQLAVLLPEDHWYHNLIPELK